MGPTTLQNDTHSETTDTAYACITYIFDIRAMSSEEWRIARTLKKMLLQE